MALATSCLAGSALGQEKNSQMGGVIDDPKKISTTKLSTKFFAEDFFSSAGFYWFRQSGGKFVPNSDPEARFQLKTDVLYKELKFFTRLQLAVSHKVVKVLPQVETEVYKKGENVARVGVQFRAKYDISESANDRTFNDNCDFSTRLYGSYKFLLKDVPAEFELNSMLTLNEKAIENFRTRIRSVVPIFKNTDLELGVLMDVESESIRFVPQVEWEQSVTLGKKKRVWRFMVLSQYDNGAFSFSGGMKIPLTWKDFTSKFKRDSELLTQK